MAHPEGPANAPTGLAAFGFGGTLPLTKDEQKALATLEGHMKHTASRKEAINPNSPQSLALLIKSLKAPTAKTTTASVIFESIAQLVERLRPPGPRKGPTVDAIVQATEEREAQASREEQGEPVSSPNGVRRSELTAPTRSEVEGIIADTVAPLVQQMQKVAASIENMTTNYRDALTRPPPPPPAHLPSTTLDPRAMVRVKLQARQFVACYPLDGDLRGMSMQAIVERANVAISVTIDDLVRNNATDYPDELRKECLFLAAKHTKPGMILLEMNSPEARDWLFADTDLKTLHLWIHNFGYHIEPKCPTYTNIAFNVPTTHDPETDLREMEDANQLEPGSVASTFWIKHPSRRRPDQSNAHLLIEFKTPDAANRAVVNGLIIRGKKVDVQRRKREPPRCRKCSKYGHYHSSCRELLDTICGTCGGVHDTPSCTSAKRHCVNCQADGHASWDRACPVFQQRCLDYDHRFPENAMPFFVTDEEWTHATTPPSVKPGPAFSEGAKNQMRGRKRGAQRSTPGGWGSQPTASGPARPRSRSNIRSLLPSPRRLSISPPPLFHDQGSDPSTN